MPFLWQIDAHNVDICADNELAYSAIGLGKRVPRNVLERCVSRLAGIAVLTVECRKRILLLGEPENRLHYRTVKKILRILLILLHQNDVQIFATTLRLESSRGLLEILIEDECSGHRLTTNCIALQHDLDGFVRSYKFDNSHLEHCV